MKILVLAPHPDDETIGCGGSLWQHHQRGDTIAVVFLTSGELGLKQLRREEAWRCREAEARRAGDILGLDRLHFLRQPDWNLGDDLEAGARVLRPLLRSEQPDRIYLPHPGDEHPDHQATLPMLRRAWTGKGARPELWGYEVWTPMFEHDQVVDISSDLARKRRALRAHRSQLTEFNYDRAMCGLNAFRGELAGRCRYAEVFQTLPWRA